MVSEKESDELRRSLLCALPLLAVCGAGHTQDASRVQPQSYKVVLENARVRVLEFNSRPGMGVCGTGMHSHPAHLSVLLTSGMVRVRTPDGKLVEQDNLPVGKVFWEEAVTHEVENVSGSNMRSLIVELKPA